MGSSCGLCHSQFWNGGRSRARMGQSVVVLGDEGRSGGRQPLLLASACPRPRSWTWRSSAGRARWEWDTDDRDRYELPWAFVGVMAGKAEERKKSSEEEDDRWAILGPLVSGTERERGCGVGVAGVGTSCGTGVLREYATSQCAAGAGWVARLWVDWACCSCGPLSPFLFPF